MHLLTNWAAIIEWLREFGKNRLFNVIVILLICIAILLAVKLITKALYRVVKGSEESVSGAERRAKTLGSVMKNSAKLLVGVFFLLAMLNEFGMNITPLLAGASMVGVALSFGAQTLVKDTLSGFFLLLENQFSVGDIINIDNVNIGTVERMTLRITVLRDMEGRAHYIPNGSVTRVIVLSKEFARALLDVEFGFEQNVDQMMSILQEIGRELHREMPDIVLEPLETKGVDAINHSGYVIRTFTKTARACQWDVARELRRRILLRFQAENIKVPVPQRMVWNIPTPRGMEHKEEI
ncbi:MAG: mechanosensitive ion channel family protein [Holophagales bacterium]|jgi:small conductance mechanosensitive channel|nr:mechanosensitive ion channel family protein [Holophagales bacterium]